jgi:hypothetical protein
MLAGQSSGVDPLVRAKIVRMARLFLAVMPAKKKVRAPSRKRAKAVKKARKAAKRTRPKAKAKRKAAGRRKGMGNGA